jgi:hypothetical protein
MRGLKLILFLTVVGPGVFADAAAATPRHLDVCMGTGTNLSAFWQAEKISATMLSTAGIEVTWRRGAHRCPPGVIEIKVTEEARPAGRVYALAHTWPYEGTRIEVFYYRIREVAGPQRSIQLLAHVMTHEIGHILEGVSRHSESGIMKPSFDQRDIDKMMIRPLTFAEVDIDLIQDGFEIYCSRSNLAGSTRTARLTGPATASDPVSTIVSATEARTTGSVAEAW